MEWLAHGTSRADTQRFSGSLKVSRLAVCSEIAGHDDDIDKLEAWEPGFIQRPNYSRYVEEGGKRGAGKICIDSLDAKKRGRKSARQISMYPSIAPFQGRIHTHTQT